MAYKTCGRISVTLPQGIRFPIKPPCLNALKVVCYGWRTPARALVGRRQAAPGAWINPLRSWTRPCRRAA